MRRLSTSRLVAALFFAATPWLLVSPWPSRLWLRVLAWILAVVGFVLLRARLKAGALMRSDGPWAAPRGSPIAWAFAALGVLGSQAFLLRHAAVFFSSDAVLGGDASAHAAIANALATHGFSHGWIDTYDGGFPLAVNYPPLAWILAAGLIRVGLSPTVSIQLLGIGPYVLSPFLALWIAKGAGARPLAALVGALALAWISPYNPWLGTADGFLRLGLVSQSVALPIVLLLGRAVIVRDARRWQLPVLGALLAAAHPQLTAALTLLAVPSWILVPGGSRSRILEGVAGAAIAGVALYGYGILHLHLPFGWIPTQTDTWLIGYSTDDLRRWFLDGELFDLYRAPVITGIWLLGGLGLLLLVKRRVPRLVLVLMSWSLALTVIGRGLLYLGDPGRRFLTFLQPQRAFALVPLCMAALVVVAAEELCRTGEALSAHAATERLGRWIGHAVVIPALALLVGFAPHELRYRFDEIAAEEAAALAGKERCGELLAAREWASDLHGLGRLSSVEGIKAITFCPKTMGVELASSVPLGVSRGAGAHVGMITTALHFIDPQRPGSARRAEALGVRWLLHTEGDAPVEDGDWVKLHATKNFALSERVGGTDTIGVGCIQTVWQGSYEELRSHLVGELLHGAGVLESAPTLIALDETSGPFIALDAEAGGCRADSAVVREDMREPGAFEAIVTTDAPVDVVIRATAFPTWVVRVDGNVSPSGVVAPGFFSVRIPSGQHHIEAVVSWPPYYGSGLCAAALMVGWVATRRRGRA